MNWQPGNCQPAWNQAYAAANDPRNANGQMSS
jgi:hypothetical protein